MAHETLVGGSNEYRANYHRSVDNKVWTAAELEKMTPSQRAEIFQVSIVNDLDEVPGEFLDSIRERLAAHIEGSSTSR